MKTFLTLPLTFLVLLNAYAIERPVYTVLEKDGAMEIRQYEEYFVAQTEYDGSTSEGFKRLFKYISGHNKAQLEIEMTAPVTRQDSVEIEMTSPVTIENGSDSKIMSFLVPSRFSESEIPVPLDERVQIIKIPSRIVATHTYSWFATQSRNQRKAEELKSWLEKNNDYQIAEGPIYAGYDAPMTLPNKKTHEMMFVLK